MIRIASSVTGNAYLPEHHAYLKYFARLPDIDFVSLPQSAPVSPSYFDLELRYTGLDPFWRPASVPVIHEYSSLSTGFFAHGRNFVKRTCNRRPVLRVFLMPEVRDGFDFTDGVPSLLRGMGVDDSFYSVRPATTPDYDLVYCGSVTRSRHVDRLLAAVHRHGLTILVIGEPEPDIHAAFRGTTGIEFTGRVARADIPGLLVHARYAVNITPDIYPFNLQESTKVLEYCAAGLPVISNFYPWVQRFQKITGGRFLDLGDDFSGLSGARMDSFAFVTPDVSAYRWTNVIDRSGLAAAIRHLGGASSRSGTCS
jgi:glycosyltransferase involved in cell wall biosynthesis